MSGVSISENSNSGLEVSAILAGGQEFMNRLQAWKDAKDAHDQAYQRLGLGQNVAAEMDKAARMTADAKAEAEAISKQALEKATASQKSLNEFCAAARDEASRAMESAQAKEREAASKLAAADEAKAAADKMFAEASAKLEAANNAHDAVKAAQAALAKAL
jgi:dTMP kinase